MSEVRWRMQSMRLGWGVEAPFTAEGKKELVKLRKQHKDKFKYCRVYKMIQMWKSPTELYVPFQLNYDKVYQ